MTTEKVHELATGHNITTDLLTLSELSPRLPTVQFSDTKKMGSLSSAPASDDNRAAVPLKTYVEAATQLMRCKVVIIGAGASGLSCAQELLPHLSSSSGADLIDHSSIPSTESNDESAIGFDNAANSECTDFGSTISGLALPDAAHDETVINSALRKFDVALPFSEEIFSEVNTEKVAPLLILEARNRIGGRIHTVKHRAKLIRGIRQPMDNTNGDEPTEAEVLLEKGAAWIHGTGIPLTFPDLKCRHYDKNKKEDELLSNEETTAEKLNPIITLLQKSATSPAEDVFQTRLNYISPYGNGWTKPWSVMHRSLPKTVAPYNAAPIFLSQEIRFNGTAAVFPHDSREPYEKKNSTHQLTVYLAGKRLSHTCPSIKTALIMQRNIMDAVAKVGNAAFKIGEGVATTLISLKLAINVIRLDAKGEVGIGYRYCRHGADASVTTGSRSNGGQQSVCTHEHQSGADDKKDCNAPAAVLNGHQNGNQTKSLDDEEDAIVIESLLGLYGHFLEVWHSSSLAQLQLSIFCSGDDDDDDGNGDDGDFSGPHCMIKGEAGGMTSILNPLLEGGVQEQILLEQEVIRIAHKNHRDENREEKRPMIEVTTASGLVIEADVCVVTLPLGVLKVAVKEEMFYPALSEDKLEAIDALGMGNYKKVFITFSQIFWPVDEPILGLVRKPVRLTGPPPLISSDGNPAFVQTNGSGLSTVPQKEAPEVIELFPNQVTRKDPVEEALIAIGAEDFFDVFESINTLTIPTTIVDNLDPAAGLGNYMHVENFWARDGIPSLEVTLVGEGAAWSIGKSNSEIQCAVLHFMQEALIDKSTFPTLMLADICTSCCITRWEEDKYSRGAYSGFILGTKTRHVNQLAESEWDGKLIFAGEATNADYEGSVHAALLSGKEACKNALLQLGL